MAVSRARFLLLFLLPLASACAPSLTRGPAGWHDESAFPFSVAPLDGGALLSKGWKLSGYSPKDQGFVRDDTSYDSADLVAKRVEDDGVLVIDHAPIVDEDRAKLPEVFAERWLDRVVANPKADTLLTAKFRPIVPAVETTATGAVGWHPVSATVVQGHTVQIDSRAALNVPGSDAAELTVTTSPPGSNPDRRIYVAIVKPPAGRYYAIIVYGNTPAMFDRGLGDARAIAQRIRF